MKFQKWDPDCSRREESAQKKEVAKKVVITEQRVLRPVLSIEWNE
jgi:hypothetical protein